MGYFAQMAESGDPRHASLTHDIMVDEGVYCTDR